MNQFICEGGLGYYPSCVTSNHFWWFEIPKDSFYFAIFFDLQVFWFFYVLGLNSCIVASEYIFWITKSVGSCFCVTTRLKLFRTDFFWFCVYVLCTGVWVNNKWCVICFSFYIASWFCRSFALVVNIIHSRILVCWRSLLGSFDVFLPFFMCNSFGNWTQTRLNPWSLEVTHTHK